MARFSLSRRTFLEGTAGTAIALPFLEAMGEKKARAATPPRRFLICFAGISLTRDLTSVRYKYLTPTRQGPSYDLPVDMSPLGKADRSNGVRTFKGHDVQSEVSVVSGLTIPWGPEGAVPEDGHQAFHGYSLAPLLSGRKASPDDGFADASSDQIVAEVTGQGTRFPTGLQYRIQPTSYGGGSNQRGNISWRKNRVNGVTPMAFEASPRAAFTSLYTNFQAPATTPEQKAAQMELLQRRKSILDVAIRRADRLNALLGAVDRARLDRHFTEIRELETRLTEIPTLAGGAACKQGADPGSDPTTTQSRGDRIGIQGWSGEDRRAEIMRELMAMALICDLARSGVLLITYAQSYMNVKEICGVNNTLHNAGHGGASGEAQADNVAWHVEQFGWLVRKLKDTPDADGGPMLDNSVLVLATEGGYGRDPDAGLEFANHSTENMSVLVAGGRNLGLAPGRHIAKGRTAHAAAALRSAMKAVGVDKPLGVITTDVPELFRA